MGRPSSLVSYTYILFSACLLALTHAAASHPPANDVTWLYPNDFSRNHTFNALDTVNVSWISAYSPTFLNLACHDRSGGYYSALQIGVPATGSRLVSLHSAAIYQGCHFEISAPANFSNISHSPSFDITVEEDQPPVFWTAIGQADGNRGGGCASSRADNDGGDDTRRKYAMIGIGVGVAVGVFAITTAAYMLLTIARRRKNMMKRKQQFDSQESIDRGSMTKDWVFNRLSPLPPRPPPSTGDDVSRHEVDGAETEKKKKNNKDGVVTRSWMERQIRKGDFYEVGAQRHELESHAPQ
ncbi:MAG: hypothetical protein Q9219_002630 [cf. Caloplaca sp. 3 TL-2023]